MFDRDTAGQERFMSLIPSYIRDSSVAVIVYDGSSMFFDSFLFMLWKLLLYFGVSIIHLHIHALFMHPKKLLKLIVASCTNAMVHIKLLFFFLTSIIAHIKLMRLIIQKLNSFAPNVFKLIN